MIEQQLSPRAALALAMVQHIEQRDSAIDARIAALIGVVEKTAETIDKLRLSIDALGARVDQTREALTGFGATMVGAFEQLREELHQHDVPVTGPTFRNR